MTGAEGQEQDRRAHYVEGSLDQARAPTEATERAARPAQLQPHEPIGRGQVVRLQGVDKVGQPIRGQESGAHRGSPVYGVEFIMKHCATAADLAWAAAKDQHVVDPRRQRQPDRPTT